MKTKVKHFKIAGVLEQTFPEFMQYESEPAFYQ